jgi:hypothetical protein
MRLRTVPSGFACLDVYFPALKCLIKTYRIRLARIRYRTIGIAQRCLTVHDRLSHTAPAFKVSEQMGATCICAVPAARK